MFTHVLVGELQGVPGIEGNFLNSLRKPKKKKPSWPLMLQVSLATGFSSGH